MLEHEAFLRQARSDFAVFQLLLDQSADQVPRCHALHYLQMSTEKLAKALQARLGEEPRRRNHEAFSQLASVLTRRRDVLRAIGYSNPQATSQFIARALPLFRQIDALCPAVADRRAQAQGKAPEQTENVEYPWWYTSAQTDEPGWTAPADHSFRASDTFGRQTGDGASLVRLVITLLDRFDQIP